ncbi:MAG: cupin [Coleofasciculaceae cyanobacterium SM2_1_6]|nr:cupin [Coleofasciculaceae cyanobacterium SM2_1_6]
MSEQDWLVTNDSECIPFTDVPDDDTSEDWLTKPYRLYRFLTDLEDIIWQESDDRLRLQRICPLVRRLLNSSEWIFTSFLLPDPATGWSVQLLYDEPDFPITIQMVAWSPQSVSPIHNHGAWGLVAILDGAEKNTFWQRSSTAEAPDQIKKTGEHCLLGGDILCFMPDAIHQIEVMGDQPTISFNVYGETDYTQRFEFDLEHNTAKIF